ncbi:M20/M25/M40 family metallo-hydrolase [Streptomyces sp. Amel2xC10]|uniref:M20/M25/M40 family metallo-hydrolase n=1 Tax=Streptomyces sp. Amel2xC10 TaxID=1305826 RepID=UPI000A085488|nr:M20/M25/M40 family metallo-hydrolase [Streptomyces sp. Amel2xC10]SMF50768.1 Acetylornithine deacetylase/Succinyl-diaminopimelate desuccinylase [Streptomyces sp. Amel2xC10]
MTAVRLSAVERELLLSLLELPTAGPLEDDGEPRLWEAQRAYADAARRLGFDVVHHAAPDPAELTDDQVPLAVRRAVADDPGFLAVQPSLVLALGPELPHADTVMFNVHLDTVAGREPVGFDGERFTGRGAIDAKGPAVALLAGVRAALDSAPGLAAGTRVLIQAVSGEEGGAMGVFGTRPLIRRGFFGRLNLFCEPTGMRLLPRSTAAMTACVRVDGDDAIDDRPAAGHNATVLLGHLAQRLAARLPERAAGGQVCVAGLHTGHLHNRVYGTGRLLLNCSYPDSAAGRALADHLEREVAEGIKEFTDTYGTHRDLARTAADAAAITRVEWHKRGLPALAPTDDPWAAGLLEHGAGLTVWPADEPAFTCDALWAAGLPGAYTAVLGPGDLGRNHAHAAGEFADLSDLEAFAGAVSGILVRFAARHHAATGGTRQ